MWIDAKGSTVLPAPECMRLLAVAAMRDEIGRIGIATDQAPVVLPVNFTVADGQILLRIGIGFLSRSAAGQLVAFEVDTVDEDAGTAWSVLARGLATLVVSPSQTQLDAAPRPLVPDPADQVLIVRPDIVTGRQFEIHPPS
jgi:hypothetical protein